MNNNNTLTPIGSIRADRDGFRIELLPEFASALAGLDGFSHVQLIWWFSGCDDASSRANLMENKPYTHGPDALGVFATRSPLRPNPIALSCAAVTYVDAENGVLGIAWTDADDGSPVLDIKPYIPSLDRVASPDVPKWCAHWPKSVESSGDFDWEKEFNF